MMVLRPIQMTDLDVLLDIAGQIGYGMTTLPPNRAVLQRRIEESTQSFQQKIEKPRGETYLFVLEDTAVRRAVGVCGIMSKVGGFDPFYSYRLLNEPCVSQMLNVNKTIPILELVVNYDGPAIIGSLFLLPDYRKEGNGRFLSLARFLFIAQFAARFDPHVIAEMRGVIDSGGRSPFWDAVGRWFFEVDFPQADYMTMADKQFIADLMPKYPLYVPLLPAAAQAVIGKVHPDTQPALKILQDEGFVFQNLVDIFEAGGVYGCARDQIRAVHESREALMVSELKEQPAAPAAHLVSNTRLAGFRACKANVVPVGDGRVSLDAASAAALEVKTGDRVRWVSMRTGGTK
jgi:arginine N-succinyltransferase